MSATLPPPPYNPSSIAQQFFRFNTGTGQWESARPGGSQEAAYYGASTGDNISRAGGAVSGPTFMDGRGGNDQLRTGNPNDLLVGGEGADSLTSGGGADTLVGGLATVTGSVGSPTVGGVANDGNAADSLVGGSGNDIYIVGRNDVILEQTGNGTDDLVLIDDSVTTPYTMANEVERLALWNPASTVGRDITGNAANNTIAGGAGDDTINGGNGADVVDAGAGNDRISVGEGDSILGGLGTDTANIAGLDPGAWSLQGSDWVYTGPGGATVGGVEQWTDDNANFFGTPLAVCFAAGTRILTARGEVAVEGLRAGDLVATLSGKGSPMKPVLWVGRRRIALAGHPNAGDLAPVRIRAGALGEHAPHRDLLVSGDHCLYLDGALVPARLLVNGSSVTVEHGLAEVTYYHVELEAHDVLLAEGAAAESWLDCDNRAWFENARVALMQVDALIGAYGTAPDASRACAEVVHGGERLAAIRDAIALRAHAAGPRRDVAAA